jgi:glyoxylase-like metal-dependent hydrolase (beta-lactamase superfamily II)
MNNMNMKTFSKDLANPQANSNPWSSELRELRELRLGDWRVLALPTGIFGLDGGAMFGTVPKVLWQKTNPPDAENRIAMEARALLLLNETLGHRVLVDCGVGGDFVEKYGPKLGPKFAEMYAIEAGQSGLERALQRVGVEPERITDVVLTHLHFDHAGGATKWDGQRLVPTLPRATYHVQKRNLETATSPNVRERASYFAANFEPLRQAGVLNLLDGEVKDLLPGLSLWVSDGHTSGQQVVRIEGGGEVLYYCGDVIPTSTHVRLAWVMGYDLRPLDLIEEKRRLLAQASTESALLYFEHDPYMDCARVAADRDDFKVSERFRLS